MVEEALDVVPQGGLVDPGDLGDGELPGEVLRELPQVDRVRLQSLRAEVLLVLTVEQELRDGLFNRHRSSRPDRPDRMITSQKGTGAIRDSQYREPRRVFSP